MSQPRHTSPSQPAGLGTGTSRRLLLTAAGGTLALPYIRPARASDPLLINTLGARWEQAAQQHLFRPFTARTGIEIQLVPAPSFAKLRAQVRARSFEFDLMSPNVAELVLGERENLSEPVDTSIVNVSALPANSVLYNAVPTHAYSTNLCYNPRRHPPGTLTNWADFWNLEKVPGGRSLPRYAPRFVPFALLADGVPKNQLYPPDIDRTFRSLDRIKSSIRSWWTVGVQAMELFRNGEVEAIALYNSAAQTFIEQGVPIEMVWQDAKVDRAYWLVPKGTPRAQQAWEFVNFAVAPENLGPFCAEAGFGPLNPKAFDFVPEAAMRRMPTFPDNYRLAFDEDSVSMGHALAAVTRRFNQWVAG